MYGEFHGLIISKSSSGFVDPSSPLIDWARSYPRIFTFASVLEPFCPAGPHINDLPRVICEHTDCVVQGTFHINPRDVLEWYTIDAQRCERRLIGEPAEQTSQSARINQPSSF